MRTKRGVWLTRLATAAVAATALYSTVKEDNLEDIHPQALKTTPEYEKIHSPTTQTTFESKKNESTQLKRTLDEIVRNNLGKLQNISDKDAGLEYIDPNNSGNPLYGISEENLKMSLSPNFIVEEFVRTDTGIPPYARIDPELVIALQKIRKRVGAPVIITSGYKSMKRNKEVGGSTKSRHVSGDAVDIYVKGLSPRILADIVGEVLGENIGLHRYSATNHVHFDLRGYKARW